MTSCVQVSLYVYVDMADLDRALYALGRDFTAARKGQPLAINGKHVGRAGDTFCVFRRPEVPDNRPDVLSTEIAELLSDSVCQQIGLLRTSVNPFRAEVVVTIIDERGAAHPSRSIGRSSLQRLASVADDLAFYVIAVDATSE